MIFMNSIPDCWFTKRNFSQASQAQHFALNHALLPSTLIFKQLCRFVILNLIMDSSNNTYRLQRACTYYQVGSLFSDKFVQSLSSITRNSFRLIDFVRVPGLREVQLYMMKCIQRLDEQMTLCIHLFSSFAAFRHLYI